MARSSCRWLCHERAESSGRRRPDGAKIPVIIYIHGLNGNAESLIDEPEALAADRIAGFTFECGNSKIDGKTVTPAHYTSRVSDFETGIAYVKTLPYVDPDRLYIYGQSYGGLVAMAAAPKHNDDTAGMILESTRLDEGGSLIRANDKPGLSQYELPEDWKSYVKQYSKDIIICCAEGDAGAYANGQVTAGVYEERDTGKVTFYSCPEGKHSFAAFSEEGKAVTLNAIRELVLH